MSDLIGLHRYSEPINQEQYRGEFSGSFLLHPPMEILLQQGEKGLINKWRKGSLMPGFSRITAIFSHHGAKPTCPLAVL
jgi:hypothetical protein